MRSALCLVLLTACAHESTASLRRAAGPERTCQASRSEPRVETGVALADSYRALGEACQAEGQQAQADEWFEKSVRSKRFIMVSAPSLPMPADLPTTKLP